MHKGPAEPLRTICLPYIHGLSGRIERVLTPLGVKAAFKSIKTLKQTLMKVKNCISEEKKRGVVNKVHCKECHLTYIGVMKWTIKVQIGVHKQAVQCGDPKNGIAVHAHQSQNVIDWDGVKVKTSVSEY